MLDLTNNSLAKKLKQVSQMLAKYEINDSVKPVRDLWVTRVIEEAITGKLPPRIAAQQRKNAKIVANDANLSAVNAEVAKQLQENLATPQEASIKA